MTESADERARVDRSDLGEDPASDAREEYTSYRQKDRTEEKGKGKDAEAAREAELQPGPVEADRDEG